MNYTALVAGILTVAYIIFRFRKTHLEKTKWAYPLLLASFPVYYFVFAIYAQDYKALAYEVGMGVVFIVAAYLAYKAERKSLYLIVGMACLLHAAYDLFHNDLFINAGAPVWWLEFCGSIDIILGFYLIFRALSLPRVKFIEPGRMK